MRGTQFTTRWLTGLLFTVTLAAPSIPTFGQPENADTPRANPNEITAERIYQPCNLDLIDTSFCEAIQVFEERMAVRVYVDGRRMEAEGIDGEYPLTLTLAGVSGETALEILLDAVSDRLDFGILEGTIVVSTSDGKLLNKKESRVYDVRDLLPPRRVAGQGDANAVHGHGVGGEEDIFGGPIASHEGQGMMASSDAPDQLAVLLTQCMQSLLQANVTGGEGFGRRGGFAGLHIVPYENTLIITGTLIEHRRVSRLIRDISRGVRSARSTRPKEALRPGSHPASEEGLDDLFESEESAETTASEDPFGEDSSDGQGVGKNPFSLDEDDPFGN